MKWAHLPWAGGLYDQDPRLLDAFGFIFNKRAEHEERERERRDRQQKNQGGKRMRPSRVHG